MFETEHTAFLAACREAPTDPGPWAIYADWVDETLGDIQLAEGLRLVVAATGGLSANINGVAFLSIQEADLDRLASGAYPGSGYGSPRRYCPVLAQVHLIRLLAARGTSALSSTQEEWWVLAEWLSRALASKNTRSLGNWLGLSTSFGVELVRQCCRIAIAAATRISADLLLSTELARRRDG